MTIAERDVLRSALSAGGSRTGRILTFGDGAMYRSTMSVQSPPRPCDPPVEHRTEVLIREARRRQRRRRLLILGIVLVLASAGSLAFRLTNGSVPPVSRPDLRGSGRPPVVKPGEFLGTWRFHTFRESADRA
jgi:hypothetical protein